MRLPFLESEALPCAQGLSAVFQHPELVEEHYIEHDQQHQAVEAEHNLCELGGDRLDLE